jgi:psp operon transcriptional activator
MIREAVPIPPLIGESAPVLAMLDRVSTLAGIDRPVLVVGERGTGKELVAARLHYLSKRWSRAFVKLNAAAVAESLLDSELFGHEAGAFTGAVRRREGRFERADGGTLFLDEIATASLAVQEKLLRIVEYGELDRIGGQETTRVDVRLIGATHRDLRAEVAAGRFRADLLDRLAFDVIHVPPLRLRGDDVELLADHFARGMAADLGWPRYRGLSPDFCKALRQHDWPGNVRELRNAVERSVARAQDPGQPVAALIVDAFEAPWSTSATTTPPSPAVPIRRAGEADGGQPLEHRVGEFERDLIERALVEARFNRRKAARSLGLTYDQLRVRLRRYGLGTDDAAA